MRFTPSPTSLHRGSFETWIRSHASQTEAGKSCSPTLCPWHKLCLHPVHAAQCLSHIHTLCNETTQLPSSSRTQVHAFHAFSRSPVSSLVSHFSLTNSLSSLVFMLWLLMLLQNNTDRYPAAAAQPIPVSPPLLPQLLGRRGSTHQS